MAANTGFMVLYKGADVTNINKVFEAMGRGPTSLTRQLTETNPPVAGSDVDAWLAMDATTNLDVTKWSGLGSPLVTLDDNGDPINWASVGLNTVSAALALAQLEVFSCDTDEPFQDWIATTLAGRATPLYFIEAPF